MAAKKTKKKTVKNGYVDVVKESLKMFLHPGCAKDWKHFLLIMLCDYAFILLIFNGFAIFMRKLLEMAQPLIGIDLQAVVASTSQAQADTTLAALKGFLFGAITYGSLLILGLLIIMIIFRWLIWSTVKDSAEGSKGLFKAIKKIFKTPVDILKYLGLSLIWFVISLPVFFYPLYLMMITLNQLSQTQIQNAVDLYSLQLPSEFWTYVVMFVLVLFVYLHVLNYSMYRLSEGMKIVESIKDTFKRGLGQLHMFLPGYVYLLIVLVMGSFLLGTVLKGRDTASMVLFSVFFLGLASYARLYIGKLIKRFI